MIRSVVLVLLVAGSTLAIDLDNSIQLECNPVCSDCQQVVDILAQIDEITAKLEASCAPPTPPPGGNGLDCPGDDIARIDGETWEECNQRCLDNEQCGGFVYSTNPDVYTTATCITKTFGLCGNPVDVPLTSAWYKEVETSQNFKHVSSGRFCKLDNIVTANACFDCCGRKCLRFPDCVGFQYSFDDNFKTSCQLKTSLNCPKWEPSDSTYMFERLTPPEEGATPPPTGATDAVSEDTPEIIAEVPEGFSSSDVSEADPECVPRNIRTTNISFKKCANQCANNPVCEGFEYCLSMEAADGGFMCQQKDDFCDSPNTEDCVSYAKEGETNEGLMTEEEAIAAAEEEGYGDALQSQGTTTEEETNSDATITEFDHGDLLGRK